MHSDQSFIEYAKSELRDTEDVMLIREEKSKLIEDFCTSMKWKYCSSSDITGSEASTVIIYDHDAFRYEPFTRAKHRLIIVTTIGKPTDLKITLKEISNGVHNHDFCHHYKKRYLKKIGAIQGGNPSAPSVFRYFQAKLGHGPEHKNHFCKYKREPKEKISDLLEKLDLPEKSASVTDGKYLSLPYVHPRGSKGHSARERPKTTYGQFLDETDALAKNMSKSDSSRSLTKTKSLD